MSKVYQFDAEDYVLKAASKQMSESDFLNLNEIDCIYGSKFGMMIKEAFRDDKHFIFARLKSRGIDKFENEEGKEEVNHDSFIKLEGKIVSNDFNVYTIIKLLFKKKDGEFIGRFHHLYPITAVNPLTNNRIIGEVLFFKIENPYLKLPGSKEERYPKDQSLSLKGIKAEFIGSDYTFTHSDVLRRTILTNCIEANREAYLRFYEYKVDLTIQRLLDLGHDDTEEEKQEVNIDSHIEQIVYKSFKEAKNYVALGLFQGFTRIFGFASWIIAILTVVEDKGLVNRNPIKAINEFSVLVPLFFFGLDYQTRNIIGRKELNVFICIKTIFLIGYWSLLISAYLSFKDDPIITVKKEITNRYPSKPNKGTNSTKEAPLASGMSLQLSQDNSTFLNESIIESNEPND